MIWKITQYIWGHTAKRRGVRRSEKGLLLLGLRVGGPRVSQAHFLLVSLKQNSRNVKSKNKFGQWSVTEINHPKQDL